MGFAPPQSRDPFRRGVATGALAGCFAVLVHSFFDFTLHTTANALLFSGAGGHWLPLMGASNMSIIAGAITPEKKAHELPSVDELEAEQLNRISRGCTRMNADQTKTKELFLWRSF